MPFATGEQGAKKRPLLEMRRDAKLPLIVHKAIPSRGHLAMLKTILNPGHLAVHRDIYSRGHLAVPKIILRRGHLAVPKDILSPGHHGSRGPSGEVFRSRI